LPGSTITLQAYGDEKGAVLTDASPVSACPGCPVLQTDLNTFAYAQPVTTDLGVGLVSTGILVGLGDPTPFGVSAEATQLVCRG
jgi:hypothetical protein